MKFGQLEHNSVELSLAATVSTHKPDSISVTLPNPEMTENLTIPIVPKPQRVKKVFGDKTERVKEGVARKKKVYYFFPMIPQKYVLTIFLPFFFLQD